MCIYMEHVYIYIFNPLAITFTVCELEAMAQSKNSGFTQLHSMVDLSIAGYWFFNAPDMSKKSPGREGEMGQQAP